MNDNAPSPLAMARAQLAVAVRESHIRRRRMLAALAKVVAAKTPAQARKPRIAFRAAHKAVLDQVPELQLLERLVDEAEAQATPPFEQATN